MGLIPTRGLRRAGYSRCAASAAARRSPPPTLRSG